MKFPRILFFLLLLTLFSKAPAHGRLIHRFSFNHPPSERTVVDSIGGTNGTLVAGAEFDGAGEVVLDGVSGYVNLANGLISKLTNATFELWVTWNEQEGYPRIFDFGSGEGAEDTAGGPNGPLGQFLLCPTPTSQNVHYLLFHDGYTGNSVVDVTWGRPLTPGVKRQLVIAYDFTGNVNRMYMDGQVIGWGQAKTPLATIRDVNNWLGRSNWTDLDLRFYGSYDEFRIYDTALTPMEVLDSFRGGPNPEKLPSPLTGTPKLIFTPGPIRQNDSHDLKLVAQCCAIDPRGLGVRSSTTHTNLSPPHTLSFSSILPFARIY